MYRKMITGPDNDIIYNYTNWEPSWYFIKNSYHGNSTEKCILLDYKIIDAIRRKYLSDIGQRYKNIDFRSIFSRPMTYIHTNQ